MDALKAMDKADPERMASKIRACRVDVDATTGLVTNHKDRKGQMVQLFTHIEQTVGVDELGTPDLAEEERVLRMDETVGERRVERL